MNAALILEDGSIFEGISVGLQGITSGEVVFNTAMTGYQEIMTDPSYSGQIVAFTSPHIGNVGVNQEDSESAKIQLKAVVMRHLSAFTSSWRSQDTLPNYLKSQKIIGITEVDTRALTHKLRNIGSMQGCIMTGEINVKKAYAYLKENNQCQAGDLTLSVSTTLPYVWHEGSYGAKTRPAIFHVVVLDFGVKHSILRQLVDVGCKVTVLPAMTSLKTLLALKPDGVLLSNGPGDPAQCFQAITLIRDLCEQDFPIFGICLGMQLLALALQATTLKLKFGHHGANHPVLDVKNKTVMITSQNHNYVVDESTLPSFLKVTHRSLFDGTIQGFKHESKPIFGFQGHPESSPGPHDAQSIFISFIDAMKLHQVDKKVDVLCQSV